MTEVARAAFLPLPADCSLVQAAGRPIAPDLGEPLAWVWVSPVPQGSNPLEVVDVRDPSGTSVSFTTREHQSLGGARFVELDTIGEAGVYEIEYLHDCFEGVQVVDVQVGDGSAIPEVWGTLSPDFDPYCPGTTMELEADGGEEIELSWPPPLTAELDLFEGVERWGGFVDVRVSATSTAQENAFGTDVQHVFISSPRPRESEFGSRTSGCGGISPSLPAGNYLFVATMLVDGEIELPALEQEFSFDCPMDCPEPSPTESTDMPPEPESTDSRGGSNSSGCAYGHAPSPLGGWQALGLLAVLNLIAKGRRRREVTDRLPPQREPNSIV